jgi:hypothetical protein
MEKGMNERATELLANVKTWTKQALSEWADSIADCPAAHVFSAIAGAVLLKLVGLFL